MDQTQQLSKNLQLNSSFLQHNGFNHSSDYQVTFPDAPPIKISDIEMITIQTFAYTSLKDIIPTSPPSVISPTHNSSWNKIPIKNPLVKQAALAYLQPMSTPPETGEKGLFGRLKERCCGDCFGFLCWFREVVLRSFGDCNYNEDCEEEEDDDGEVHRQHEKV